MMSSSEYEIVNPCAARILTRMALWWWRQPQLLGTVIMCTILLSQKFLGHSPYSISWLTGQHAMHIAHVFVSDVMDGWLRPSSQA